MGKQGKTRLVGHLCGYGSGKKISCTNKIMNSDSDIVSRSRDLQINFSKSEKLDVLTNFYFKKFKVIMLHLYMLLATELLA